MSTKVLKSLFSIIKFVITVLAIGLVAIILVQRFSNNNRSIAGYRIFTVVTESMLPKYEIGDVLLVKQVNVEQIQKGDDITYKGKVGSFADKIVTHQVINIAKGEDGRLEIYTKGIANDKEDPIVYEDQVYGIVQTRLELITKLNGIINNMYGMYFLIIIPLAIIMFSEFKTFKEDDKYDDDDDEEDDEDDEDDEKNKKAIDKKIQKRKEKRAKRRRRYE